MRDATTGDCEQTLAGHTDLVCSAAFSPTGRQIVSACYDKTKVHKTVRVWDAAIHVDCAALRGLLDDCMSHIVLGCVW